MGIGTAGGGGTQLKQEAEAKKKKLEQDARDRVAAEKRVKQEVWNENAARMVYLLVCLAPRCSSECDRLLLPLLSFGCS